LESSCSNRISLGRSRIDRTGFKEHSKCCGYSF
jgi:hypothetical protein